MKKQSLKHWLAVAAASLAATTAQAQTMSPEARVAMRNMQQSMRSEEGRKLGSHLMLLQRQMARLGRGAPTGGSTMPGVSNGYVSVTAYAIDNGAALKVDLESHGMIDAIVAGNAVSGRIPVTALGKVSRSSQLRFMRPNLSTAHAGLVTSQADATMLVAPARQAFRVDGRGVRVGVLSDSFDVADGLTNAADDVESKDLPANVKVLRECDQIAEAGSCIDEGRAMLQLIHDLAPASDLSFHTTKGGEAVFAAGIRALAAAGARVIVDDVIYFSEPMFQDGLIAQAVNEVARRGVTYFSSAGNFGRDAYAAAFRPNPEDGLHDFDPGPGVDITQRFSVALPPRARSFLSFQWDEPFASLGGAGSRSNLDIAFLTAEGQLVPLCGNETPSDTLCQIPGGDPNVGGDALEIVELRNLTNQTITTDTLSLAIELVQGPAPRRMQYVSASSSVLPAEYLTRSPTLFGHANAAGAEAVAAAFYRDTIFNEGTTNCLPACAESFSSVGGVPILFNTAGQRLPQPLFRANKPGITAVDGTNTTFFLGNDVEGDGFPNFFGTSAAAPHAAAVAALMYDRRARSIATGNARRQLTPTEARQILRDTAIDITLERSDATTLRRLPVGGDVKTGAGLIQAISAVQQAQ
jgi:subtilisin family serine protease